MDQFEIQVHIFLSCLFTFFFNLVWLRNAPTTFYYLET